VQTQSEPKSISLHFHHIPAFAAFLLSQKLDEFVDEQLKNAYTLNIPLMQAFTGMPAEEVKAITTTYAAEFLTYLSKNSAEKHIQDSVRRWMNNGIPNVDKYQVLTEDIYLIALLRKKTLMHFLPVYCQDAEQMLKIIEEIDVLMLKYQTICTNAYIQILEEKIEDHSHLISKINKTLPGAIYIFDTEQFRNVYTNDHFFEVFGYSQSELNTLGTNALGKLIHPEDQEEINEHLKASKQLKDGEISSYKFRILKPGGQYEWLRTYTSVFKRNEDGTVVQTISITLNVHKEKIVAEELKQREAQLLEAQEIAQLGSFSWNLTAPGSTGTPQLASILEVGMDDHESFMKNVHPQDRQKLESSIQEAFQTGFFDCEYRYQGKEKEKVLWGRGKVSFDNGKPVTMTGTVMDITQRQFLIKKLEHSQRIYKQAEEMANIGNWSWDIKSGNIIWTDQLYRIYGLSPQSENITINRFLDFVHPDDKQQIQERIQTADQEDFTDMTFRIVTPDHQVKTLRSMAMRQRDENGNYTQIVGTEQDITDRETLFQELAHSQSIYKQAETLAHIGSWSWEISNDKVVWTDELYRIFGLEPQSSAIDFNTYASLLHPDDRDEVLSTIKQALESHQPYQLLHRIQLKDGSLRYVHSHGEVFVDKDGKPYKMIGTAQDITERQNLIQKLQESEKLNRQAQSMAKLGSWIIDLHTMEFIWSEEMYQIYEMDGNEKPNIEEWFSMIHPEDREDVKAYWEDCLSTKKPYDKIHRIVLHNGKVKTLHRKGELIFDDAGRPLRAIGTTQDITEQHRIQKELKDNQIFINKITDATPSIITSYNVNTGQYVFVNAGIKKLLGYDKEDVMREGVNFFLNILHPDDLPKIMAANASALEKANAQPDNNNTIVEFTYRLLNHNNEYRWVTTYGTIFDRNSAGQVEHILNITLDVTAHVQATEKIEEQERFIKQLADASPTILYLFDAKKNAFSYINHEVYYILGYTPEEVLEMKDTGTVTLYHPDDIHLLPERKETQKRFQHSNSMIQYECRMKNKQHDWCWLLVREVVFKRDEVGNPLEVLGAALDITKRKEMERSLLQNAHQLQQSNASLEEFAYVASHDLKEPLRKISTFGDRLFQTQEARLGDDGKLYLKKIIDASQRMQVMINDLLSISMISGDRSFETCSLQSILDEIKQTLEYKIEHKNAKIESDPLPEIQMIPSQFRQLIQNLLSNSLKFTKEDRQPVIRIRYEWLTPEQLTVAIGQSRTVT
jgi:PAS domain S-box-containing protein